MSAKALSAMKSGALSVGNVTLEKTRSAKDMIKEKVSAMPESESRAIEELAKGYDVDGSGDFSVDEVKAIILDLRSSRSKTKMMKWFVMLLILVLIGAFGAIFGVSYLAVESAKESHTGSDGMQTTLTGNAVKTEALKYEVEIFDAVKTDGTMDLEKINVVNLYLDARGTNTLGNEQNVEATFSIEGALKQDEDTATLLTNVGAIITVDTETKKIEVEFDSGPYVGKKYPATEDATEVPASSRRKMSDCDSFARGSRERMSCRRRAARAARHETTTRRTTTDRPPRVQSREADSRDRDAGRSPPSTPPRRPPATPPARGPPPPRTGSTTTGSRPEMAECPRGSGRMTRSCMCPVETDPECSGSTRLNQRDCSCATSTDVTCPRGQTLSLRGATCDSTTTPTCPRGTGTLEERGCTCQAEQPATCSSRGFSLDTSDCMCKDSS